ncbi:MAG: hypothetical protein MUF49_18300 [Oculatellaceae cyanobacterium Prado106]|nr:hypothetical protein [Oculatellaceae cyanobacterium Prado106]
MSLGIGAHRAGRAATAGFARSAKRRLGGQAKGGHGERSPLDRGTVTPKRRNDAAQQPLSGAGDRQT